MMLGSLSFDIFSCLLQIRLLYLHLCLNRYFIFLFQEMEVVEYFNTSCRVDDKSSNATDDSEITIWFLEIQNAAITLVLISLYVMNTILGIFWNLIVIHAFRANRLPRNILLLHVCIADLLVCVISGPSSLIIIMQPRWRLGWISCKIVYFLQVNFLCTSIQICMCIISQIKHT